ncbi:hypothetical protein PRZ48_011365 [Zasmidium cellare]|uniref:BTB domain-containing protein n=1 Tax=Zasmidium cellare TaxID=395010 RepID=A0ABR0E6S1_ZASCE|nr:hypothetical protein PRZ48_011365 [Zasmidium cellare]
MATISAAPHVLDPTITTIVVGPEKRRFAVHKSVLCHSSNYFRAAYASPMTEAKQNHFIFSDVSHVVFSRVVTWIYNGKICLNADPQDPDAYQSVEGEYDADEDGYDSDRDESAGYAADIRPGDPRVVKDVQQKVVLIGDEEEAMKELKELRSSLTGEQMLFHLVHPYATQTTKASELDAYQLRALIQLSAQEDNFDELAQKWKEILAQKESDERKQEEQDQGIDSRHDRLFMLLIRLYVLADRFDIPQLRHDTMDYLQNGVYHNPDVLPSFEAVTHAFDNLPSNSKLRLWLVHIFAYTWNPDLDSPEQVAKRESLPKDFILEVMLTNTRRLPKELEAETSPLQMDWCVYHDHTTHEEVQSCREHRGVAADEDDDEDEWCEEEDAELDE